MLLGWFTQAVVFQRAERTVADEIKGIGDGRFTGSVLSKNQDHRFGRIELDARRRRRSPEARHGEFANPKDNGFSPDILLGFRNKERIIEYEEYIELGEVFLTTEDGSRGEKGFLTAHPVLHSSSYDIVYCCGPDTMMKAVAAYCSEKI